MYRVSDGEGGGGDVLRGNSPYEKSGFASDEFSAQKAQEANPEKTKPRGLRS